MNWLITGGCGFIGISLIKTLMNENNHNIRVLDNLTTTKTVLGKPRALGSLNRWVMPTQP